MAENKGKWSITIAGCSSSCISGWCFWEKKESGDGSWSASCLLCWGLASWPTPASRGQSFRPACWGWPGIGRFTDSLHGTNPEDVISNMTAWSPDLQLLPHLSSPLSLPETLLIFPDQTVITSPGSGTFSTPRWHWIWTSSCEWATLPEKYPHQLQLILGPLSDLCLCSRTNSMKALHRQMKEKFIETWQSCFTVSTELSPPTWTSLWSVAPNITHLLLLLCQTKGLSMSSYFLNSYTLYWTGREYWPGGEWWSDCGPPQTSMTVCRASWTLLMKSFIPIISVDILSSSTSGRATSWSLQSEGRLTHLLGNISQLVCSDLSEFWWVKEVRPPAEGPWQFSREAAEPLLNSVFHKVCLLTLTSAGLFSCKLLSPGWFTLRRPTTSCLVRRIISDITKPLSREPGWGSPLESSLQTKQT